MVGEEVSAVKVESVTIEDVIAMDGVAEIKANVIKAEMRGERN